MCFKRLFKRKKKKANLVPVKKKVEEYDKAFFSATPQEIDAYKATGGRPIRKGEFTETFKRWVNDHRKNNL